MTRHEDEQGSVGQNNQEPSMNRAEYNAANEKLLEDQLGVSEDKVVDYVPGEN